MTLRAALVIVYSLSVAGAAIAQSTRIEEHQQRLNEARQLLAKDDAKSIAWGAFNVASYQLPGLTKELTAALDRVTADDGAGSLAVNALLDAVVQTHAAVPAGISTSEPDGPSDNDRLIYLQHLAGNTWQAGAWPAYHAASIPWRGEAMFQDQVSDQRELELERYRLLLSELVQANRLSTDDERRFAVPNLQIAVVDRRTDQSRALPALAP